MHTSVLTYLIGSLRALHLLFAWLMDGEILEQVMECCELPLCHSLCLSHPLYHLCMCRSVNRKLFLIGGVTAEEDEKFTEGVYTFCIGTKRASCRTGWNCCMRKMLHETYLACIVAYVRPSSRNRPLH